MTAVSWSGSNISISRASTFGGFTTAATLRLMVLWATGTLKREAKDAVSVNYGLRGQPRGDQLAVPVGYMFCFQLG